MMNRRIKKWMNPANVRSEINLRIHWALSRLQHGDNLSLLKQVAAVSDPYRPVFILGPPRCGSTLLYQVMLHAYRFAYFQNRMERHKYSLGRYTLRHIDPNESFESNFESEYGRTHQPNGPHEGGFFWRQFFKRNVDDYVSGHHLSPDQEIEIIRTIHCLQFHFKAPFLSKNLVTSLRLKSIQALFPEAVYIVVKRDPRATASSLLSARIKMFGTREKWFSLRPKSYQQLVHLPGHLQTAGQVTAVYQAIYEDFNPQCRMIELSYESLCSDPRERMTWLSDTLRADGITLVPNNRTIPKSFPVKKEFAFSQQELNEVESYFRNEKLTAMIPFEN